MATRIVGADTLASSLRSASRHVGDLDAPCDALATELARDAAQRAPRRTGRLASSGRVVRGRVSFGLANVQYAVPTNFGTGPRIGLRGPHNIPATRFFTAAIDDAVRDAPETFTPPVQRTLDRVKGA